MSTTTARKEKNPQNKFDLNSIRTVMLLYFFTFAAVLIMLIWSLQSFFMTHYFEQMKVSEISSALGIQEKTVRMQLTRARRLLKDYLESEEAADE